jgi:hypothetical protein
MTAGIKRTMPVHHPSCGAGKCSVFQGKSEEPGRRQRAKGSAI